MLQKSSNFAMWFYGATLRMSNVGHLRNKKKLSFFLAQIENINEWELEGVWKVKKKTVKNWNRKISKKNV